MTARGQRPAWRRRWQLGESVALAAAAGGGSLARARCWRRRQRGGGVGSGSVAVAARQRRRPAWRRRQPGGQVLLLFSFLWCSPSAAVLQFLYVRCFVKYFYPLAAKAIFGRYLDDGQKYRPNITLQISPLFLQQDGPQIFHLLTHLFWRIVLFFIV